MHAAREVVSGADKQTCHPPTSQAGSQGQRRKTEWKPASPRYRKLSKIDRPMRGKSYAQLIAPLNRRAYSRNYNRPHSLQLLPPSPPTLRPLILRMASFTVVVSGWCTQSEARPQRLFSGGTISFVDGKCYHDARYNPMTSTHIGSQHLKSILDTNNGGLAATMGEYNGATALANNYTISAHNKLNHV